MAYYPKVAELHYKDKTLNVKIPIRVKLIKLKKYFCKKCMDKDRPVTITRIAEHADSKLSKKGFEANIFAERVTINGALIPKALVKGDGILCPGCEENILKESEVELIKVYTTKAHEYVDIFRLTASNLYGRWKFTPRYQTASYYPQTLKELYDELNAAVVNCKVKNKKYKNKKLKLIIEKEKVTMRRLRKDLGDYEGRKLLKAI